MLCLKPFFFFFPHIENIKCRYLNSVPNGLTVIEKLSWYAVVTVFLF